MRQIKHKVWVYKLKTLKSFDLFSKDIILDKIHLAYIHFEKIPQILYHSFYCSVE